MLKTPGNKDEKKKANDLGAQTGKHLGKRIPIPEISGGGKWRRRRI